MNYFKADARLWMNIIYSRVTPCTYMTIVIDTRARIVACFLLRIAINIREIMISKWRYFKKYGGINLSFHSLITELCKMANVEEYGADTLHPGSPICPLMFRGEGASGQSKKRKTDSGKSAQ